MSRLVLLRVATRPFAILEPFAAPGWEGREREARAAEAACEAEGARLERSLFDAAGAATPAADPRDRDARHAVLAMARAIHNHRELRDDVIAAGRLAPDLEAEVRAHAASRARAGALRAEASTFVAESLARSWGAIEAALRDPIVAEGLCDAAGALAAKALTLGAGTRHGERHVAAKVLAYLARAATKTSPQGVFCATALARCEGAVCSAAGEPGSLRRDVLLSVAEARKIACTLAADPEVEAAVIPRPNPTLREQERGWTFWRLASSRHADDREHLSRVHDHPVVRMVLEESSRGDPLPEVRRRSAARAGVDAAAIAPLIDRMIGTGALVAEIEIPYNERRPLRFVAGRAREAGCRAPWIDEVLAIEEAVDGLAALPPGDRRSEMRRVRAHLETLPRARPLEADALFRVDAATAAEVVLPEQVLEELRRGLSDYSRLFAAMYPASRYRLGWVRRFLSRFAPGTDVNLLDVYRVLTEQGETYRPTVFPEPDGEDDAARRAMESARSALAARAAAASPGEEIALREALAGTAFDATPEPRWAAGALFQVAAASTADASSGRFRVVLNRLFQGAGLSLSRFAHLLGGPGSDEGNPVVRELKRAWSVVGRAGATVAEITYNHLGRTANAGLRPSLFPCEIELPGDAVSPGATRIALADLVVRWDPREDRFVLRCPARDTEIIPIINSGVSPVGFVAFLVAIGEQDLQPIGYLPGFGHPDVRRWPRVVSGRVVLFRERWSFRGLQDVPSAPARGSDLAPFAAEVSRWRARHGLPRFVFAHSSREPKPRFFDLESPAFLDLLRRDLRPLLADPAATVEVTEMLPGPGEMWIGDGEGRGHAAEFLVQASSIA